MEWTRSLGKRLLAGNVNLISTPFPVTMFEPRSYLEKLADVWVYPRYLSAAAAASSHPVERMKLVITWFIAGDPARATCMHAAWACMHACGGHACKHGRPHCCLGMSIFHASHPMGLPINLVH